MLMEEALFFVKEWANEVAIVIRQDSLLKMNVFLSSYRHFTLLVCLHTSTNIPIHVPKVISAKIPSQCYACYHLPESWKDFFTFSGQIPLARPRYRPVPSGVTSCNGSSILALGLY